MFRFPLQLLCGFLLFIKPNLAHVNSSEPYVFVLGESVVDYIYSFPETPMLEAILKEYNVQLGSHRHISLKESAQFIQKNGLPSLQSAGGSVANTAYTLAQLNRKVIFSWQTTSKNLQSSYQKKLSTLFETSMSSNGIILEPSIGDQKTSVGCAITLTTPDLKERSFLTAFGPKESIHSHIWQSPSALNASIIVIEAYLWSDSKTAAVMAEGIKKAHSRGARIILTLGSQDVVKKHRDTLIALLPFLYGVIGNKEEIVHLLKKNQETKIEKLFKRNLSLTLLVVTKGEKGAVLYHRLQKNISFAPLKTLIPAEKIPLYAIQNTSGAGDAFAAGIVEGIARGLSTQEMGMLGSHLAGHVICQPTGRIPPKVFEKCKICKVFRTRIR